jgi:hypothetical protein
MGIFGAIGNVLGGLIGANSQQEATSKNIKYQKQFATHGIRWKVEDARAAGIHPLAALGAQTMPFQSSVGGKDYSFLGRAGQNIDRAVKAKTTPEEKLANMMQVELAASQSELYRAQAKAIRDKAAGLTPGTPPGMPQVDKDGVMSGAAHSQGIAKPAVSYPGVDYQNAQKVIQKSSGIEAGREGMFREVNFPDGSVSLEITESIQDALSEGIVGNARQIGIFAEQALNDLQPSRTGLKKGHRWKSKITPSGIRFYQVKIKKWTTPKNYGAYLYWKNHEKKKLKSRYHHRAVKRGPEFNNPMFK